jgi:hypothetical protein
MHHFFNVLMPVAIIGTFGASVYFFTKVLTDYVLKKRMIEKGFVNEESQSIFKEYKKEESRGSSLKWGLIILSAGFGLILIDTLDVRPDSTLPYGIFAVAVSIGYLVYFYMMKREVK